MSTIVEGKVVVITGASSASGKARHVTSQDSEQPSYSEHAAKIGSMPL